VAFPKLKFFEPLEMTSAPGTDRMFVVERKGKIFSFVPKASADKPDLLLDLEKPIYGLAFHPQFARNGYFYVTYIPHPEEETPLGTRVARFQVNKDNPLRCDRATEKVVFEWPSGGHNGGCLRFGPDGYLYIATGDGSGIADELHTGQDVSDVL